MLNIDFIQINKLSQLHDGQRVFFCKMDYPLIDSDFVTISKLNNDVIFITGNSDYAITDDIVNRAPKNIKKWYCQNALSNKDIVHPIPIGLENREFCCRPGHGIGYGQRVADKEQLMNTNSDIYPEKFIYANFNIWTNVSYRQTIKDTIDHVNHIDWHNPSLDIKTFFEQLRQYKMVLCPIGNGIDTHRLWETLYCNRIPITIKIGNYKIYELYKKLPIVLLQDIKQLLDKNFLIEEYDRCLSKKWDRSLLDAQTWINNIKI